MIVIVFVLSSQSEWNLCVSPLLPSLKQLWNVPNPAWIPNHLTRSCFWLFDNSLVSTIITQGGSYDWITSEWLLLYCFTPTKHLLPLFQQCAFYNIRTFFLILNSETYWISLICIMQTVINELWLSPLLRGNCCEEWDVSSTIPQISGVKNADCWRFHNWSLFLSKQLSLWFFDSFIAIASCICIGFCFVLQWEKDFMLLK